jgi:hypothetical protein
MTIRATVQGRHPPFRRAGPPPLAPASGDVIEVERTVYASGNVSLPGITITAPRTTSHDVRRHRTAVPGYRQPSPEGTAASWLGSRGSAGLAAYAPVMYFLNGK